MKENQNVPARRFPGFDGAWERKTLGEISDVKGGKRIPKGYSLQKENNGLPYITVSDMQDGTVLLDSIQYVPTEVADQIKNYKITTEDIYISVAGTLGEVGIIPKELNNANLTENANKITNLQCDQKYLLHYFRTDKLGNLIESVSTVGAQPKLAIYALKEFEVFVPTLPEQQKIATFFTTIDQKISQLKEKKNLLEQYKKGAMQALFAQQLRFRADDGSDFPDWEEKKLGEVGTTFGGLSGKTKEDFGSGKPYIQYKQIFDNSRINSENFEFVKILEGENQNRVQFGDVLFTISSETPNEIGMSSVFLSEIDEVYLNSFCFGYRAHSSEELSPFFAEYLFRSRKFRDEILKLAQGSTRYNMSKTSLMQVVIALPCAEEQRKISEFLNLIDERIKVVTKQIAATEQWKKGLLQQMFC